MHGIRVDLNYLCLNTAWARFMFNSPQECFQPFKVISGSMTKVTCSMTKAELHHFHLVNILSVKS